MTFRADRKFLYMISGIVVGFLLILVSFPVFGRLIGSFGEMNSLKTRVLNLTAKRDTLESVDAQTANSATTAVRTLPTKIGAMAAVAQIQAAANQNGVNITRISATVKDETNPQTAQIKVDVQSPIDTIDQFLKAVETTLPYVKIGGGKVSKTAELLETSIIFETYWKDVPNLPGVEVALPALSQKEKDLLTKIKGFKETTTFAIPVSGQGRPNPFSF